MRLLFLCDIRYWNLKVPRTRFHAVEAMREFADVHCSGRGFPDWNDDGVILDNLSRISFKPDWIFVYKPDQYVGWHELDIPTATSFNDAWETKSRVEDIALPRCKTVIMHHRNELDEWKSRFPEVRFEHIPYPVNPEVFKDYGESKTVDVLLTGAVDRNIYPLRYRFSQLISRGAFSPHKAVWRKHPGYRITNPEREAREYAKAVNGAKVCLVDTSRYGYAAEKYHEIPACRSVLCGNMPEERQEDFHRFLWRIDSSWTDTAIVERVKRLLASPLVLRTLQEVGYKYVHENHTVRDYAKRFIEILS